MSLTAVQDAVQFEVASESGICVREGCNGATLACEDGICTSYHPGMATEPEEWYTAGGPLRVRLHAPRPGEALPGSQLFFAAESSDAEYFYKEDCNLCYNIFVKDGNQSSTLSSSSTTCVKHFDPLEGRDFAVGNYSVFASIEKSQGEIQTELAVSGSVYFQVTNSSIIDIHEHRRREGFRAVYAGAHWGGGGGGRSGPGSTAAASRADRALILRTLLRLAPPPGPGPGGPRRPPPPPPPALFDAGCGALVWQPLLFEDFARLSPSAGAAAVGEEGGGAEEEGAPPPAAAAAAAPGPIPLLRYHGRDIVPELAERHRRAWGEEGGPMPSYVAATFSTGDLANDRIPKGYDIIVCRHVLFHNPNDVVAEALKQFNQSGASFLLATTLIHKGQDDEPNRNAIGEQTNPDVLSLGTIVNAELEFGVDTRAMNFGGYRPVALAAPPFLLPPPLAALPDSVGLPPQLGGWEQVLAVWELPLPPAPALSLLFTES